MNAWLALPLEVFPGWPQPESMSTIHIVLLTVLGPLSALLLIVAIGWTPRLMRKARAGAAAEGVALSDGHAEDNAQAALTAGQTPARRAAIDD